jgi:hypothetical protein
MGKKLGAAREAKDDNTVRHRKDAIHTPDNWGKNIDTKSEHVIVMFHPFYRPRRPLGRVEL